MLLPSLTVQASVTPAAIGSYIQLVFPDDYGTISSTASPACTNVVSGATLACTVNEGNNTIGIYNYFADSSTLSNTQIEIMISNIKNPSRAEETADFEFYIKKPDNTVIDRSPLASNPAYSLSMVFTHGSFTSCSISANNNYISTRSKMTLSITPNN